MKNLRKIKTSFVLSLFLLVLIVSSTSFSEAAETPYRASVIIELEWADGYPTTPIAPRDEIAELDLKVTMNIKTGITFGAGVLDGYISAESAALIDLAIVEFPSWCSATLDKTLLMTNISEKEEVFCKLFIHVDENAPAYEEGIIKFEVNIGKLGLIKGSSKVFNLSFMPSFYPLIRTELPESNSKRINPTSEAVFPIEIQNVGNAETKVLIEIIDIPGGWTATVTDSISIGDEKGSKEMAYLTVRPSRDFGYHYEETVVSLKITPAFASDLNITGNPIYANFIVQARGFSSIGIEVYLILFAIIVIVLFAIIRIVRKRKQ